MDIATFYRGMPFVTVEQVGRFRKAVLEEIDGLEELNKELLEALEQCRADLLAVHLQYGDRANAAEHCAGIRLADSAIANTKGE